MPNASFFPLFHHLSSVNSEERVSSVGDLISLLNQDGKTDELDYTTTRLVRGLTSSRAAARQGFSLGLCSLLRDGIVTDVDAVLSKLQEETKTTGLKGEEERDRLLGRVFGLLALIRSGKLTSDEKEHKPQVAKLLCELAKEKSWFKELCTYALCLLADDTTAESGVLQQLDEIVQKRMEEDSLELSAVRLALHRQRAGEEVSFDHINRKRLTSATNVLHGDRMHMVWEQVIACCAATATPALAERAWTELVEPQLLRSSSQAMPKEHKVCAWRLFARLAKVQPEAVPSMLTRPLLLTCIGLKPAPLEAYDAILLACEAAPQIRPSVVERLLEFGDFDGKTRTKTMAKLMLSGGGEGVVTDLVQKFASAQEDDVARAHAVDSLFDTAKMHLSAPEGEGNKLFVRVLRFFYDNGVAVAGEEEKKKNALCRRRFFSLLTRCKPEDFLPVLRAFSTAEEDVASFPDTKLGRTCESLVRYLGLLQLDEEEEVVGAEEIIQELTKCAQAESGSEEADLLALVDMILAMCAQPNSTLRDLVKQLTRCLATQLAESQPAIELLMSVLVTPKDEAEEAAAGEEDEDDDEEDEEEEEDAEEAAAAAGEVEEDAVSGSDSDDSEDDDSEEEEEEEEPRVLTGEDAEEMEAYDRALGEMLKSRIQQKPKTSEKDQATAQAMVFKLRVLDLLEVILNKTGASALLESLPKFLRLLESAAVGTSKGRRFSSKQQKQQQKVKGVLAQPSSALFNRLQSITKKLFQANASELPEDVKQRVLKISGGLLKRANKQDQLLKAAADAVCFLAIWNDDAALEMAQQQLLPLLLTGHANCKVLFSSLSLLADKIQRVELLVTTLVQQQARTQFQGELQLELLFKLLKRAVQTKSALPAADLSAVFLTELDMGPKRLRLLLSCLQFYVKSFPTKLAASQIDEVCKRWFDKTPSPPVKQLCLQLVSDKSLLQQKGGDEAAPGSNRKKARLSIEDRKQPPAAAAATPEAKRAKTEKKEKTPKQQKPEVSEEDDKAEEAAAIAAAKAKKHRKSKA